MPRRPFAPVVLLAIAVAISACSSSPAASAPAATPSASHAGTPALPTPEPSTDTGTPAAGTDLNACEIVTAKDIATALGMDAAEIGDGELEETPTTLSPGHSDCDYTGEWGGISVSLTPEDGENLFDAARGAYADASDRVITGADGAFWSASQTRGFFWKGAVTVMFQVGFLAGGGDRDEIVTALGQAALDKVD